MKMRESRWGNLYAAFSLFTSQKKRFEKRHIVKSRKCLMILQIALLRQKKKVVKIPLKTAMQKTYEKKCEIVDEYWVLLTWVEELSRGLMFTLEVDGENSDLMQIEMIHFCNFFFFSSNFYFLALFAKS